MSTARIEVVDGIRMKVVGRPRPPLTPEQALRWNFEILKLAPAELRRRPKGVFRFKTWEEVAEWDRKMLNQTVKSPSR